MKEWLRDKWMEFRYYYYHTIPRKAFMWFGIAIAAVALFCQVFY